jgi:UPF0176 protein
VLQQAQTATLSAPVLLAEEGINLFLAGRAAEMAFFCWLRGHISFADLEVKQS